MVTLALALSIAGVGAAVAAGVRPVLDGGVASPHEPGDGRLVLISGRDDHGLLATARVVVRDHPGGGDPVGRVDDGTLARVIATNGTWLEVRTVEGPAVQGWVDDFYLRGVLHLVGPDPDCRVRLGARRLPAGEQAVVLDVHDGRAQVRLMRTGEVVWVARSDVRELSPTHGCGPSGGPAPSDEHSHQGAH